MPKRKDMIIAKWQPNGDIRFHLNDKRKGGVPELVMAHQKNVMPALICGNVNHVILEYDTQKL